MTHFCLTHSSLYDIWIWILQSIRQHKCNVQRCIFLEIEFTAEAHSLFIHNYFL